MRIAVITDYRDGIKPAHWGKITPRFRSAGGLLGTCQSADCTIVLDARLPRTLAGLLAGGALGLAGALMQTLTRNPLADPGLLGVNAGASFAIVLGAALFGYSSAQEQLAMAFAGALVASLIVALYRQPGRRAVKSGAFNPRGRGTGGGAGRADQRHRPA